MFRKRCREECARTGSGGQKCVEDCVIRFVKWVVVNFSFFIKTHKNPWDNRRFPKITHWYYLPHTQYEGRSCFHGCLSLHRVVMGRSTLDRKPTDYQLLTHSLRQTKSCWPPPSTQTMDCWPPPSTQTHGLLTPSLEPDHGTVDLPPSSGPWTIDPLPPQTRTVDPLPPPDHELLTPSSHQTKDCWPPPSLKTVNCWPASYI